MPEDPAPIQPDWFNPDEYFGDETVGRVYPISILLNRKCAKMSRIIFGNGKSLSSKFLGMRAEQNLPIKLLLTFLCYIVTNENCRNGTEIPTCSAVKPFDCDYENHRPS